MEQQDYVKNIPADLSVGWLNEAGFRQYQRAEALEAKIAEVRKVVEEMEQDEYPDLVAMTQGFESPNARWASRLRQALKGPR